MADATSLMPPSTGLGATLLSIKRFEPYSPKGPQYVKITTLYRCTGRLLAKLVYGVAEDKTVFGRAHRGSTIGVGLLLSTRLVSSQ